MQHHQPPLRNSAAILSASHLLSPLRRPNPNPYPQKRIQPPLYLGTFFLRLLLAIPLHHCNLSLSPPQKKKLWGVKCIFPKKGKIAPIPCFSLPKSFPLPPPPLTRRSPILPSFPFLGLCGDFLFFFFGQLWDFFLRKKQNLLVMVLDMLGNFKSFPIIMEKYFSYQPNNGKYFQYYFQVSINK